MHLFNYVDDKLYNTIVGKIMDKSLTKLNQVRLSKEYTEEVKSFIELSKKYIDERFYTLPIQEMSKFRNETTMMRCQKKSFILT